MLDFLPSDVEETSQIAMSSLINGKSKSKYNLMVMEWTSHNWFWKLQVIIKPTKNLQESLYLPNRNSKPNVIFSGDCWHIIEICPSSLYITP